MSRLNGVVEKVGTEYIYVTELETNNTYKIGCELTNPRASPWGWKQPRVSSLLMQLRKESTSIQ